MTHEIPITDPSLIAGNQTQPPLEQLRDIRDRVLPILDLEGEEFDAAVTEFVATRMQELPVTGAERAISVFDGGTDQFIGPETAMVGSALLARPYHLDDIEAYKAAFGPLKQYYESFKTKLPPDRAYLNAALAGTNYGQAIYFESFVGDPSARLRAMGDIIDEDLPETNSIADFKKIAVCQERAGVAHNTLKILGVDSQFEVGRMSVKNEDGTESSEAHAFITFTGPNGDRVLFDPTNPVLIKNENGSIVSIIPTHFKIDDPAASEVTGDLKERTIVGDSQQVTRVRPITYAFHP